MKSVKHIIKSMKQKYGSNPYMDAAAEATLPKSKCLPVKKLRNSMKSVKLIMKSTKQKDRSNHYMNDAP